MTHPINSINPADRPLIYVPSKGAHDYSDAQRFGELVFMSEGRLNRYAVNKMFRTFDEHIQCSNSNDLILITSLTVMNAVICGMFASKHNCLNLLLFKSVPDGPSHYVDRRMVFDNKMLAKAELREAACQHVLNTYDKGSDPCIKASIQIDLLHDILEEYYD